MPKSDIYNILKALDEQDSMDLSENKIRAKAEQYTAAILEKTPALPTYSNPSSEGGRTRRPTSRCGTLEKLGLLVEGPDGGQNVGGASGDGGLVPERLGDLEP